MNIPGQLFHINLKGVADQFAVGQRFRGHTKLYCFISSDDLHQIYLITAKSDLDNHLEERKYYLCESKYDLI
jgi:hypothetical protein